MKTDYKFFIASAGTSWGSNSVLMASGKEGGYLFNAAGEPYYERLEYGWRIYNASNNRGYQEISFAKGIQKIDKNSRHKVYKKLGIKLEPIIITEETRNKILNKLRQSRAFSADSALDVGEDSEIYLQLEENGEIKSWDSGFYLVK